METMVLKVSTKSVPNKVAAAIAGMVREGKNVEVQSIGAGALNQAVKALAIANKFVENEDFRLTFDANFVELEIDSEERTGLKLGVVKVTK